MEEIETQLDNKGETVDENVGNGEDEAEKEGNFGSLNRKLLERLPIDIMI